MIIIINAIIKLHQNYDMKILFTIKTDELVPVLCCCDVVIVDGENVTKEIK